jgi:hypothetical protein
MMLSMNAELSLGALFHIRMFSRPSLALCPSSFVGLFLISQITNLLCLSPDCVLIAARYSKKTETMRAHALHIRCVFSIVNRWSSALRIFSCDRLRLSASIINPATVAA